MRFNKIAAGSQTGLQEPSPVAIVHSTVWNSTGQLSRAPLILNNYIMPFAIKQARFTLYADDSTLYFAAPACFERNQVQIRQLNFRLIRWKLNLELASQPINTLLHQIVCVLVQCHLDCCSVVWAATQQVTSCTK